MPYILTLYFNVLFQTYFSLRFAPASHGFFGHFCNRCGFCFFRAPQPNYAIKRDCFWHPALTLASGVGPLFWLLGAFWVNSK